MQIVISYDSSAANAPAAFKTAVQAAVAYWDQAITTNVTVNIQFSYGELNGSALDSSAVGESQSNYSVFNYAQVKSALTAAATSTDDKTAVATLPASDLSGGGEFWVTNAEQKALGLYTGSSSALDGYVALNSGLTFNFDPTVVTHSQQYDAIGVLEHEISEVLGRIAFVGGLAPDKSHVYSPMDLFRYSGPGQRAVNLTTGDAYFSVDGQTMLTGFNNGATWGGDSGDWNNYAAQDSFGAFVAAGMPLSVSSTDLRLMDLLGYTLGSSLQAPTTPAAQGAAPAQYSFTQSLSIAAGTNVNLGWQGLVMQYADPGPAPSLTNAGTIFATLSGAEAGGLVAVSDGTAPFVNGATQAGTYANSTFTNTSSGKLYVLDTTNSGNAMVAVQSNRMSGGGGPFNVDNQGLIQVVSLNGASTGVDELYGAAYTVRNSGTLNVWSEGASTGVSVNEGATVVNSGSITVTGKTAVGVNYGGVNTPATFTNSGSLVAATNAGTAKSIGVEGMNLVNSGTIIADIAVSGRSVTNTGSIQGLLQNVNNVTNRGVIDGEITLNAGMSYDGRHGQQAGGIDVSMGSDTVIGGVGQTVAIFDVASTTASWAENSDGSWTVTFGSFNLPATLINVQTLQFTDKSVTLPNTAPEAPDVHDFFGDLHSASLLENAAGQVAYGEVSGGTESYTNVAALGPEWRFVGTGDYLNTGRDQFLIENSSGVVEDAALVNGQTRFTHVADLGSEWSFEGSGDFLGDRQTGFLIQNTSGAVFVGEAGAAGQPSYTQVAALGSEWSFEGAGDFLGLGHSQFLIENTAGAVVVGDVENGRVGYHTVAGLGAEWKVVETGDFLNHNKWDFLIENTSGAVVAGEVGTNGQASFTTVAALGSEWKFVGAGDYLAKGYSQFLIENAAGAVFVGDIQGGRAQYAQVGALGSEWSFHA